MLERHGAVPGMPQVGLAIADGAMLKDTIRPASNVVSVIDIGR
jgi:hypothetical protein